MTLSSGTQPAPLEFADGQLGCFLGLKGWGERKGRGRGTPAFFSGAFWPRFPSPGYVTPEENHALLSPTPFPFCGAFHKCSCFSEKVYFGSCFHLTYIKHSHKAEARRECRVACLLFVFFSVTGEGSRHTSAFGLGAELKWPVGLPGAASCRKLQTRAFTCD